jgi:pimeloyl-ACP methyl ester carboxylesterase
MRKYVNSVRTSVLDISYEDSGPPGGSPILILHGWPDAPRGWNTVAKILQQQGWRTILPYLRGCEPTRFLSDQTFRDGSGIALAQDAIDLADALQLERFAVVGHDWGARAAYTLAALWPERVKAIAALSLSFQPRSRFHIPDFEQSRRFWYQWFQCTDGGAEAVRKDPVAFARIQWDTWSPPGWFDEDEFQATVRHFAGSDWPSVTLNAYRTRWLPGEKQDSRYAELRKRLSEIEKLSVPCLMIQGQADFCDAPKESENLDPYFSGEYRRVLLEGVGHFPHREAPTEVASTIGAFLSAYT